MFRKTHQALATVLLLLAASGAASSAGAAMRADQEPWCGTHPAVGEIVTAKSGFLARRAARHDHGLAAKAGLVQLSAPQVSQQGDVIIMVDDGTLIQEPNPSDASGKGYRLKRGRQAFKLTKKPGALSQNLGRQVALADDDSALVPFEKGFKFKFFGTTYTEVYINSDGNLTFGQPDSASTSRNLGRALNGPARVMAYFTDLDPSASGEVFVNFVSKGKMVVTWREVVEWGGFTPNTFQVTLFKKGHVEFRFGEMNATAGIIGVSPGGGSAVSLLDFSEEAPTKAPIQAVAEVFGDERLVDESAVAQTFYDHFEDDVHQMVLFYDFPLTLLGGQAVAYHFTLKNDVKGIGYKNFRARELFDNSSAMGSDGVLEGFANMGYVHKYDDNLRRLRGTLSHLGVFIHEIGHQWLSRVFYRRGGETHTDLQEFGGHWAFTTHSQASFMQGNFIQDNGNNTFLTLERDAIFSEMDLYMMGLLEPEEVPDFFYVANSNVDPGSLPQFNSAFSGNRVDVGVDDVIREEGRREPGTAESRKEQRVAMILLVEAGAAPQQRSVDKVQNFADLGAREWSQETDGAGALDYSVTPK